MTKENVDVTKEYISMTKENVGWKAIAIITADILVSPWNLLVGGLLISRLSFAEVVVAALLGYGILALTDMVSQLEIWLGFLGFTFPVLIVLTIGYYYFGIKIKSS